MHPIFNLSRQKIHYGRKANIGLTCKYRFHKRSEKYVVLEVATDRRSVKIGILKSMIKLLKKYRVFLVKLQTVALKLY